MNVPDPARKTLLYASAAALCLVGLESATIPLPAQTSNQDVELELGQEIFNESKAKTD